MNIVEIKNEIAERLKHIRTPEELRELQRWAKKQKNKNIVEPRVTSFKQMYYTWYSKIRSSGSGRLCGERLNKVDYTSFVFLGIEIKLPQQDGVKYIFNEEDFTENRIWVDRYIKYGGTEYFPKQDITEYCGINLYELFISYLKEKSFFIVEKNIKTYFLCNSDSNAIKIMMGKKLNQFDLCNNPVSKISKENIMLLSEIKIKRWDDFYPPRDQDFSTPEF